jgi:hypothetical protein
MKGNRMMHKAPRKCPLLISMIVVAALGACTAPGQQVCADQGFAAGTPEFDQCVSTVKKNRAAMVAAEEQRDLAAQRAGNLAGSWKSGCAQSPATLACNYGN